MSDVGSSTTGSVGKADGSPWDELLMGSSAYEQAETATIQLAALAGEFYKVVRYSGMREGDAAMVVATYVRTVLESGRKRGNGTV